MRKVLLMTYHFPPSAASGSFRLLGFARHLPKYDWQVAVVAPPSLPWEGIDEALRGQVPPSTKTYPVDYPKGVISKPFRRLAPYWIWLARALPACVAAMRDYQPDIILSSGPPHCVHLLGLALKRLYGTPWVVDFRDPWMTAAIPVHGPVAARWYRRLERAVLAAADTVICNAPGVEAAIGTIEPELRRKLTTITNGFDPEAFASRTPSPRRDGVRMVHTGDMYEGRDPRPLFDAMREMALTMRTAPPVYACFAGQVCLKAFESGFSVMEEVKRRGLDDSVEIHGHIPYSAALQYMIDADILLLLDQPGRRTGVPAKLYEYLGAARPILALAEPNGDVAWVLERSGLPYRIAPPRDVPRITLALRELVAEVESRRGEPRASCVKSQFTREQLAGRLAGIMCELSHRGTVANLSENHSLLGHPECQEGACV